MPPARLQVTRQLLRRGRPTENQQEVANILWALAALDALQPSCLAEVAAWLDQDAALCSMTGITARQLAQARRWLQQHACPPVAWHRQASDSTPCCRRTWWLGGQRLGTRPCCLCGCSSGSRSWPLAWTTWS